MCLFVGLHNVAKSFVVMYQYVYKVIIIITIIITVFVI